MIDINFSIFILEVEILLKVRYLRLYLLPIVTFILGAFIIVILTDYLLFVIRRRKLSALRDSFFNTWHRFPGNGVVECSVLMGWSQMNGDLSLLLINDKEKKDQNFVDFQILVTNITFLKILLSGNRKSIIYNIGGQDIVKDIDIQTNESESGLISINFLIDQIVEAINKGIIEMYVTILDQKFKFDISNFIKEIEYIRSLQDR